MRRSPHRQVATILVFLVPLACSFRRPSAKADDGVKVLRGHAAGVFSVALSRDGQVLASASNDNTVRVWDVATGAALDDTVQRVQRRLGGRHFLERLQPGDGQPGWQCVHLG